MISVTSLGVNLFVISVASLGVNLFKLMLDPEFVFSLCGREGENLRVFY